jgi:PKD repeat protein
MIANLHKLKVVLLGAFALTLTNNVNAQEDGFKCATDAKMKVFYDKNPQARIDRENFFKNIFASRATYDDSTIYTIPIVFHILHKYGVENIPDANVYSAMNILNDDFRNQSFDAAAVIPEFQPIMADCKIQFKLPTLDPNGNCTNGIEHIYTHEITEGDDFSKLNQWPRDRYLNVWVCDVIGEPGAAGYAYQPAGVDGLNAFADGIILKYDYIGSLSPSNVGRSRALTHEIGHYLVLDHTWGSTNDPTVACGNDGIGDTPVTKGHNTCTNKYDYFCDNVAISSTTANPSTYRFDSLLTTSGSVDPSPAITVNDSGLVFSNAAAVGVSTNSQTAGMFDFEKWDTGAPDTTTFYSLLTGSINTSKYYEFTVTPVFGQVYSLTALTFSVTRDTSGVRTWCVRSSRDGYAANLTASISPANTDLSVQAGNIFFMKYDSTEVETGSRITLSGASFTDEITPITFRIYGFNAEDTTGSFGVDNIAVTGTYGTIENVENYMEYSYCSKMYTEGQKFAMRTTLNQAISYRNNLWTAANLTLTGTDYALPASFPDPAAPLCKPMADFTQNEMYICSGGTVAYTSECWGGAVSTYAWSFPGGTPSTSSSANPTITYTTPGYHDVILTVSNASGSDTKTKVHGVYVSNTYADYNGPTSENFESSGTSDWWMTENDEDNEALWHRVNLSTSASGNYCFKLNNHNVDGTFGYSERLGGSIDALISPSYNLSGLTGGVLSFKYSCATHATIPEDFVEKLRVYSSIDCGKTWLPKSVSVDGATAVSVLQGATLANAGVSGGNYVPGNSSSLYWETGTITLTSAVAQPNVRFRFEYTASDKSNNIYLDDINITGVIGINESDNSEFDFSVYPNPLNANESLILSLEGSTQLMQVAVYDVMGHVIYTKSVMNTNGSTKHEIPMANLSISKGVYFVSVQSKTQKHTKKVVVK